MTSSALPPTAITTTTAPDDTVLQFDRCDLCDRLRPAETLNIVAFRALKEQLAVCKDQDDCLDAYVEKGGDEHVWVTMADRLQLTLAWKLRPEGLETTTTYW